MKRNGTLFVRRGYMVVLCMTFIWTLLLLCPISKAEEEYDLPKIQDVQKLSVNLLMNYSKHIIPSRKMPFNISIVTYLDTLGNIDELEEMLSYVFWLGFSWKDESIKWDKNDTDVEYVMLPWSEVWTPVLRVSNPHSEISKSQNVDRSYETVIYSNEGKAYFQELMTTRTTCDLDMTYYPFDIQTCLIKMFIVGHLKFPFRIETRIKDENLIGDKSHGSWMLINRTVLSNYGIMTIKLMFERRPLFLLINIFMPIIVLALLTPVVFILPKKSGERVGYSITMLLAISVYMTIVSEHLPHNSQPMPLISVMIFICYMLDASIVFVVIINTKINAMKNRGHIPFFFRKFVLLTRKLLTILTCEKVHTKPEDESIDAQDKDSGSETLIELQNNIEQSIDFKRPNEKHDITWQDLSNTIDKWCFVISYLCKILLPVIFFSICKTNSR
ncbi:5-hydroxytryptamine receptor 3A-like isoform X2 [Ruditapes philippinarum]|uniref:5-hydroxytryptamine receptor 3A-like isoform X2 n=1 Tax=Ruditapes philippinarum TaxID=129788 RepID=UPI00295C09B1|nr:5-hydroxytryptamine receptor 3A-like isoform X2 [Ruditapes philippinarum]